MNSNNKILIDDITIDAKEKQNILSVLSKKLQIPESDILSIEIKKASLDARNKNKINFVYSVIAKISNLTNKLVLKYKSVPFECKFFKNDINLIINRSPVIIGAGPSGLFLALALVESGYNPIIFEQGKTIEERDIDVLNFFKSGKLNINSNIQFGEGGAGTYSDGKLTARSENVFKEKIFEYFIKFGANPEIKYLAKPHLGTDELKKIIKKMINYLIQNGTTIKYNSKLTDIILNNGKITGIKINNESYSTDTLFLCSGISSDNTYKILLSKNVESSPKGFAVGFRIEHQRQFIDESQFGNYARKNILTGAEYFLKFKDKSNNYCHTFCMCPGGFVIAASCKENTVLTNGMSLKARNNNYSNSAVIVPVFINTLGINKIEEILKLRFSWEKKCFVLGGGNYHAPYQKAMDFISGNKTTKEYKISYSPGGQNSNLNEIYPVFIQNTIKSALFDFNKKIKGFAEKGILIGCETTISSPVRILRDNFTKESLNIKGLFPVGEGSGYSSGIISSACDGYSFINIVKTLKN